MDGVKSHFAAISIRLAAIGSAVVDSQGSPIALLDKRIPLWENARLFSRIANIQPVSRKTVGNFLLYLEGKFHER